MVSKVWVLYTEPSQCLFKCMARATIPSLFLRFVLILQCHVLVNLKVLISKKCPYLLLASLFFLFSVT